MRRAGLPSDAGARHGDMKFMPGLLQELRMPIEIVEQLPHAGLQHRDAYEPAAQSCPWTISRICVRRAHRRCSVALNSVIVGVAPWTAEGASGVLYPDIYVPSRPTRGEYTRDAPGVAPATGYGFPQFAWQGPARPHETVRYSAAHLVDIVPGTRSRQYIQVVSSRSSCV